MGALSMIPVANNWVQATPDCAFCSFPSQGSGAPDPARSSRRMRTLLTVLRWCVALILCAWGIYMVTGFVAEKFDGGSEQPMWFDLLFVTFIGLVPLAGGLMLIFIKQLRP